MVCKHKDWRLELKKRLERLDIFPYQWEIATDPEDGRRILAISKPVPLTNHFIFLAEVLKYERNLCVRIIPDSSYPLQIWKCDGSRNHTSSLVLEEIQSFYKNNKAIK